MTATTRSWTARQARYDTNATVIGSTRSGGLTVHYLPTLHGILARCWVGDDLTEVALLRRGNLHATFQGTVTAIPGGWRAKDANGNVVVELVGPCVKYVDAEAPLLRLRNGVRSFGEYAWPVHLVRALRAERAVA